MVSRDPLENFRRQQEQLRRAIEGPMLNIIRSQEAVQRALDGPMKDLERMQEQVAKATQGPVLKAAEQQHAWQETIDRTVRALDQSKELQRALEKPLAVFERNRAAIARAVEGPYAAILRNQDAIRAAMEAAAAAAEEPMEVEDEQQAWLQQWAEQVRPWAPSWEQVELFLDCLAFLIALVLYAASKTDTDLPEETLTQVGLLCAAGALLIRFMRGRE